MNEREMTARAGTLYGVSVGPGDPELMTLRAVRTLDRCPVVAAPVTGEGRSLALDIAAGAVDLEGKTVLSLSFEMTRDPEKLAENHQAQARRVREQLDLGRDVAFVCLGDITVYSTFQYIAELLEPQGVRVEMIPGVTSFCAAACALGRSLTGSMKTPLHILPGGVADLDGALAQPGVKVVMKSGRRLARVREEIAASGAAACAVVDCGLPTQRCYPRLEEMPEETGYFTTVIVGEKL